MGSVASLLFLTCFICRHRMETRSNYTHEDRLRAANRG